MSRPDVEKLTDQLLEFIDKENIVVDPEFTAKLYKSGVYAVIDCVFSSMAVFAGVISAMKNFGKNSGLLDAPDLKFSDYLDYVKDGPERPTKERFDDVAAKIFCSSGVISGRRKVEVVYDVCQRFVDYKIETLEQAQALPKGILFTCEHPGTSGELEKFVIGGIAGTKGYDYGVSPEFKVHGIGLALGAYMLILLGDETFVKPDKHLLELMGRIGEWSPRMSNLEDFRLIRQAISCAADKQNESAQKKAGYTAAQKKVTPASLDNALWAYEAKRSAARKKLAST